jgi:hypothetical protein
LQHERAALELRTLSQVVQVTHHEIGHVFEKVDIVVTDTFPRLVVEDAVSPNTGSTGRFDGHPGIEASMRSILHVRPVAKPLILQKVVDDVDFTGVLVVLVGSFVSIRDVDSMLADR